MRDGSFLNRLKKLTICSIKIAEKGIAPNVAIARATSTEPAKSVAAVITATRDPHTTFDEDGGFKLPPVVIIDNTNVPLSAEVTRKITINTSAARLRAEAKGK